MPTKAKSFRQLFWRFARPLIVAYLLALVGCAAFQNKLIYFPSRASETDLLAEARRAELEPWRDESGAIVGWRSQHPQSPIEARFLVVHGNAGYAVAPLALRGRFQRGSALRSLYSRIPGLWSARRFAEPTVVARSGRASRASS
jgi:hypothetical protein